MSTLGTRGRAGNSMFQYAFLRGYAKAMGAELQTPPWWGRKVFPVAAADPLIDRKLPQTHCDSVCHHLKLPLGYFFGTPDIDLVLYGQHQTFIDFYTRAQCREWFALKPELEEHQRIGAVAHYRRGDYSNDPTFQRLYTTISDASYDRAFEKFGFRYVEGVFEGCSPARPEYLNAGIPWLSDFLKLRNAEALFRSNSTFSWWAATLGHGKVYSPVVGNKTGNQDVEFVSGNHPTTAGIFPNQSDLYLKES